MRFLLYIALFLISWSSIGQSSIDSILEKYNTEKIPYITVEDLAAVENVTILDTRETHEFEVSHLKNAIKVGYDHFSADSVLQAIPDKEKVVVVYCSVGIRSEDIGNRLKELGYQNVFNLYGGIFEWKHKDLPLYNKKEQTTDSVHVFSKEWGTYLLKGIKVY